MVLRIEHQFVLILVQLVGRIFQLIVYQSRYLICLQQILDDNKVLVETNRQLIDAVESDPATEGVSTVEARRWTNNIATTELQEKLDSGQPITDEDISRATSTRVSLARVGGDLQSITDDALGGNGGSSDLQNALAITNRNLEIVNQDKGEIRNSTYVEDMASGANPSDNYSFLPSSAHQEAAESRADRAHQKLGERYAGKAARYAGSSVPDTGPSSVSSSSSIISSEINEGLDAVRDRNRKSQIIAKQEAAKKKASGGYSPTSSPSASIINDQINAGLKNVKKNDIKARQDKQAAHRKSVAEAIGPASGRVNATFSVSAPASSPSASSIINAEIAKAKPKPTVSKPSKPKVAYKPVATAVHPDAVVAAPKPASAPSKPKPTSTPTTHKKEDVDRVAAIYASGDPEKIAAWERFAAALNAQKSPTTARSGYGATPKKTTRAAYTPPQSARQAEIRSSLAASAPKPKTQTSGTGFRTFR